MQKIIITTTNTIEGVSIEKYYGLVTANLVIGTNIFSDFVASFSDFFGGMSGTYKKQLQLLYKRAIDELTANATSIGANAVVGVKMDFDEISGKGKSMFMVSIYGTAVRCLFRNNGVEKDDSQLIDSEKLSVAVFLNGWKRKSPKLPISSKEWEFILSHKLPSISKDLFGCREAVYNKNSDYYYGREEFDLKLKEYFSKLDEVDQIGAAYFGGLSDQIFCTQLICQYNLFSPSHVLSLIKHGHISFAVSALAAEKMVYNDEDLSVMKEIISVLDSLPDLGTVEEPKKGLLSSKGKKYVCPNGHRNEEGTEFCFECGQNIKGITSAEANKINAFRDKVEVLEMLLNSKID